MPIKLDYFNLMNILILKVCYNNAKPSRQEVKMFEVTDKAGEMMGEYFKDKEDVSPSIRITLSEGG